MIPKIIHFCWFGNKKIPKEYKRYIATWKKYCPEYKIYCWTEKKYNIKKNKFMQTAYQNRKWGFVPDYARLDIIYHYGGIYLDTDVEVLRNLDDLLKNKMFVGMENGNSIALGLGFGAEKGHPFVKELRDRYKNMEFIMKDGEVKVAAAPRVQTPMFENRYHVKFKSNRTYYFDDCTVYAQEYFCPESFPIGQVNITENTYSWHHYSASWFSMRKRVILKIGHFVGKKINRQLGLVIVKNAVK